MTERTVYEVVYYDGRAAGAAGDCTHVARFRRRAEAAAFAAGRAGVYGEERAEVSESEVSGRLWARWERDGQLR